MQITIPIDSEILTKEEIANISGNIRKDKQITWLDTNGWKHQRNAAGEPNVGRWYARMKLAGIDMGSTVSISQPDFSKVI